VPDGGEEKAPHDVAVVVEEALERRQMLAHGG
jgi:hypothetical protein